MIDSAGLNDMVGEVLCLCWLFFMWRKSEERRREGEGRTQKVCSKHGENGSAVPVRVPTERVRVPMKKNFFAASVSYISK